MKARLTEMRALTTRVARLPTRLRNPLELESGNTRSRFSCLLPFMALARAVANSLGPDPAEHLMHVTGDWVMRFLVLVLLATACT